MQVDDSPYNGLAYCEQFPRDFDAVDQGNDPSWPLYWAQVCVCRCVCVCVCVFVCVCVCCVCVFLYVSLQSMLAQLVTQTQLSWMQMSACCENASIHDYGTPVPACRLASLSS
jgi:hypothetical protein